jgi:hypothetical protein
VAQPVNKWGPLGYWWPQQEAVALAVEWANLPQYQDVGRVVRALNRCDAAFEEVLLPGASRPVRRFDKTVKRETELVRAWLAAAIEAKGSLYYRDRKKWDAAARALASLNDELATLRGEVIPEYKVSTRFGKWRGLSERIVAFRPRPLAWAALGVALVATPTSIWPQRVGRCLYHEERFVFNAPRDGVRGPLRSFYCAPGCKVQRSRKHTKKIKEKASGKQTGVDKELCAISAILEAPGDVAGGRG